MTGGGGGHPQHSVKINQVQLYFASKDEGRLKRSFRARLEVERCGALVLPSSRSIQYGCTPSVEMHLYDLQNLRPSARKRRGIDTHLGVAHALRLSLPPIVLTGQGAGLPVKPEQRCARCPIFGKTRKKTSLGDHSVAFWPSFPSAEDPSCAPLLASWPLVVMRKVDLTHKTAMRRASRVKYLARLCRVSVLLKGIAESLRFSPYSASRGLQRDVWQRQRFVHKARGRG